MKKIVLSFVCLGFLSACADDPAPVVQQQYSLPPKISLDVQNINFIDQTGSIRAQNPYGINPFHPMLGEAVEQWAKDRLQAVGTSGQATVVVKDASLSTEPLPLSTGIGSWFKRQQASKYTAHIAVEVSARRDLGYAVATADASRWITMPEDASKSERQDAYYSMLNSLMRDLGQNLEANMQDHLRYFIAGHPAASMAIPTMVAPTSATIVPMESAPASGSMVPPPIPTFVPVSN